jgi:putative protease
MRDFPSSLLHILQQTYIHGICALEHVRRLVDIGGDSLKIESNIKSMYYAAHTAQVYRRAIDAVAGQPSTRACFTQAV